MKYATFINFTDQPFTGYWDGRAYTFQPSDKKDHLPELIARHFAKHLTNRELTKRKKEKYCSPKRPEDVPEFMEIFNKAFYMENNGQEINAETGLPEDGNNTNTPTPPSMNVTVTRRESIDPYDAATNAKNAVPNEPPQIIGEDEEFEGKAE